MDAIEVQLCEMEKVREASRVAMATGTKAIHTFLAVVEENYRKPPTDVTVVVGQKTFECHKSVLDSWSEYFRAVFTSPMSEQEANTVRIEEGDYVTADSFELLLAYMYSGKIEISEENVIGILRTAHYLQMMKIVKLCKVFIDENNAVSVSRKLVLHLAEMDFPDLQDVQSSAMNHLTSHLYEYIKNTEFIDLNRALLQRILEKDEVGAWDEDQIFVAVLEWLLKDEERYQHGDSLLSKVRLGCVSAAKLRLVRQHVGLLPHLTTVEPIITDMIVSSVLEEKNKTPCKEKYPEMYLNRQNPAKEHLERMVPVCYGTNGDAYYWGNRGWVPYQLDLEDCCSNIALGGQTLYKISKSGCLMSQPLYNRKWTLVSRLPDLPSYSLEIYLKGSRPFLVCLGSYVYILSTGMSMQYDIENNTWCLFDTNLTTWNYISRAAACYSKTDPKRQVIVLVGLQTVYDIDDSPLIAIGDPQNGWRELTTKWADRYGCYAATKEEVGIEGYSDTINLTVIEEDNSILAVTNGPVVYSLSLSDLPHGTGNPPDNQGNSPDNTGSPPDNTGNPPQGNGNPPHGNENPPQGNGNPPQDTGNLPEWQEVPIRNVQHFRRGFSLVTWNKKKYHIFRNILIPDQSKSDSDWPDFEDLRYNPRVGCSLGIPELPRGHGDWLRLTLGLLPEGLIHIV